MPITLTAALERSRLQRGVSSAVHLVAELTAPPAATERPPLSLVLAIDTSGSMDGEKLRQVVSSVELLLGQLGPKDRVGLVGFSSGARVLMPLTPVSPAVRRALAQLQAAGGTNVEAGLRRAAELLAGCDGRGAVLLLSDGQPNAGALTSKALAAVARTLNVPVSTLGYGEDHAEDVLAELAEAGRGTYAYVPRPELCRIELARAVSAQAETVAEGVTLCIEPHRGVTLERVLGAPSVGSFDDGRLEVPLPDFLAAERRPVAFSLKLEPFFENGPTSLVRLVLKQRPALVVEVGVSAEVAEVAGPLDPAVRARWLLCAAREVRSRAVQLADAGAFDDAKAELEKVIADIRGAPAAANSAELSEALEQLIDDAALMQQRPDAQARSAFRRGQMAPAAKLGASPLLTSAFSNVPRAKLIIVEGAGPAEVPLLREMVVGRTADADLQLQSSAVSRRHTRIVASEGAFWVNDLGSSNGTSLNGVKVRCERLRDGDLIQLGNVKLLYRES